jgi:hypothetical protein
MRPLGRLAIVLLLAAASMLLSSCSSGQRAVTTQCWPITLMPDGKLLAYSGYPGDNPARLSLVDLHTGDAKPYGKISGNLSITMIIDEHRWICEKPYDSKHQVFLYDPTNAKSRLLVQGASFERISGELSPDHKTLLFKRDGLNTVDLATGRTQALLAGATLINADWFKDSNHVVVCYEQGKPAIRKVGLIDVKSVSISHAPRAIAAGFTSTESCLSGDGTLVAYPRGSEIVCRSVATNEAWTVTTVEGGHNSYSLAFPTGAHYLLVSNFHSGNTRTRLVAFDTRTKQLRDIDLDLPVSLFFELNCLDNGKSVVVMSLSRDHRSVDLTTLTPSTWHSVGQARNL